MAKNVFEPKGNSGFRNLTECWATAPNKSQQFMTVVLPIRVMLIILPDIPDLN
jgi:hypothetical protein